jgi:type III restriction enzyme
MTDDTKNCDEVADYLESLPDLAEAVLTIHTKNNGEISESSTGKAKDELENLRRLSNEIDADTSPYKAIVSVLMLKEGWDVRNVTTIVGLRAYSSKSNILPEQTLGRGLRKMYYSLAEEYVSVIGTKPFMDFIESIKSEGVELERRAMGEGTEPKAPLIIEVDRTNRAKNLDKLDIEIPILTPRFIREYKNLSNLDITFPNDKKVTPKIYTEEELKAIVFKELTTDQISHITYLDSAGIPDYRSVIGWFTKQIMKGHRLFSGYDVLYEKVQSFIKDELFIKLIPLEDPQIIRNLSEPAIVNIINTFFKEKINALTISDKGDAEVRDYIKLRNTKSIIVNDQESLIPKKSVFNRIIGDSHFELEFASFLEQCPDVISYAKNSFAIGFKIEYTNSIGELAHYYPDFIVKVSDRKTYIVETKGLEDLDDPLKLRRLKLWCEDINKAQSKYVFDFLYVDQDTYKTFSGNVFNDLLTIFSKYK